MADGPARRQPSGRTEGSRERYRDLIYQSATGSREGRRTLLSGALALVVFLLLVSLSARQVTEPVRARHLIEAGIASTSDVDRVIADEQPALVQLAQSSTASGFLIPEYPLRVYLARDELSLPAPALKEVILSRSSALVYEGGLGAFDRTGHQSFSRLSSQGLLDLIAGQVTASTYHRASAGALLFSVLLALLAGAVLVAHTGWSRLRVLGIAFLAGSVPVVFLSGLAWFVADRVGGSDPYVSELRALAHSVIEVPLRNGGIVSVAAILLVLAGAGFGYLEARFARIAAVPTVESPGEGAAEA